MSYNILSYIVYAPILLFTTIYVGWVLYKNGHHYLQTIFDDQTIIKPINKILLIGYYLTNCGYAILKISSWNTVNTQIQMINELIYTIGLMYLLLGSMHMINVIAFKLIGIQLITHQKI